jgi:hypothetical protein
MEYGPCLGIFMRKILAHADGLAALPGKSESGNGHDRSLFEPM